MMAREESDFEPRDFAISEIRVGGFKSLVDDVRLPIRPLTVLAGANSSGKSSALQPLLLLKQTLEASYDPGPLLLRGPHVRFTTVDQMLSKVYANPVVAPDFRVGIQLDGANAEAFVSRFHRRDGKALELRSVEYAAAELDKPILFDFRKSADENRIENGISVLGDESFKLFRSRCFALTTTDFNATILVITAPLREALVGVIHVPGTRGNPERSYPTAAIGSDFPGTFGQYTASIVHSWQEQKALELEGLQDDLKNLNLTWGLIARQVDAVQIELRIGRHASRSRPSHWKSHDLVNVADVGFGVSQVLPVLVALRVAKPGQLVYLEQPEIHLHPRAQVALATILADAARRGVRVVAETHSELLLLAIQALVARGELPSEDVILHWFQQRKDGTSEIMTAELDQSGAYGDWPEDFGSVSLAAQKQYLDAVEKLAVQSGRGK